MIKFTWQLRESHEAIVSDEKGAELLGIEVGEIDPADPDTWDDPEGGLADALGEIEGNPTYDGYTERFRISVQYVMRGIDLLKKAAGEKDSYDEEDFRKAGLPMVMSCTRCTMTMAGASALLYPDDDGGYSAYCAGC